MAGRQAHTATAPSAHEHVVCKGGPWDGWWFTRSSFTTNRDAAKRLHGAEPVDPAGPTVSLGYQPTEHTEPNPDPRRGIGRVWRWAP
jgi:hypothetical protein